MATNKELLENLDELANSIVTEPEKLAEFARMWAGGFHRYTLHNTALVWAQLGRMPGVIAGFNKWKEHGRYVKRGESAKHILCPSTKTIRQHNDDTGEDEIVKRYLRFIQVPVFDVSQTDGEPLEIGASQLIHGQAPDFSLISSYCPYPVNIAPPSPANGWTDGKEIWVAERKNSAMVATLAHEWAHNALGHTGLDKDGENLARDVRELEAEATSYLVCCALGIDNQKSALYIGDWHGERATFKKQGARILSAADKIIKAIEDGEKKKQAA